MAKRLLPRSPTPHEEFAYQQWGQKYFWPDRRCDWCGAMLPDRSVNVHDVYDRETGRKLPTRVYCNEVCYAHDQQPERIVRGGLE